MKITYATLFLLLITLSVNAQRTFAVRVNSSTDDAEEAVTNGDMYTNSSDLELVYDDFVSDDQHIGMRFTGITIPTNATVINAYIQFQVDEDGANDPCDLSIFVENSISPLTYSMVPFDISSRTYVNTSVNWSPADWPSTSIGDQLAAQRTSNLKVLVDSVLSNPSWVNGSDMAFMISGTGTRIAESFDGDASGAPMLVIQYEMPNEFLLQVFHASDLEGGVDAIEDAPSFAAIIDRLEEEYSNTIKLSSGDNYIPGPFFNASSELPIRDSLRNILSDFYATPLTSLGTARGRIDVSIMNVIGFDASAFGNHEFDQGVSAVQDIILSSGSASALVWMGAQFPYLSANLDFSASSLASRYTSSVEPSSNFITDVLNPATANSVPKVAPATIVNINGENIGVIGATTQLLESISSPGDVTVVGGVSANDMIQLASVLQPYIDSMTNQSVNKVIVVSHLQQFALEQQLAGLLNGVDIILAGGSDYLLADEDDVLRAGDIAAGNYPFQTVDGNGDSVLIVSTDGEYSYVGRLVVAFDANGHVLPSTVYTPTSGAWATTDEVVQGIYGQDDPYESGTRGRYVQRLTNSLIDIVVAKDGNTFGKTNFFLEGRRGFIRTEETNLGNLTADANLWLAKQFDPEVSVSIKNGGGIRAEIGSINFTTGELLPPQANPVAGKEELEVSQLDIENALRFNNLLKVVETTPAGLKALLEHGISDWDGTSTQGKMPQIGGVRFSFDPTQAVGSKIQSMALINEDDELVDSVVVNGAVHGDTTRTIKLVSLNFLIDGDGDGYPFSATTSNAQDLNAANLPAGMANFTDQGSEQDALAEYLLVNFTANPYNQEETEVAEDTRIQILSLRDDSVLVAPIIVDTTDTTTNISNIDMGNELIIYPNPSNAVINVSLNGESIQNITLFNVTGQVLKTYPIRSSMATLNLLEFESGVYFLKVDSRSRNYTRAVQLTK